MYTELDPELKESFPVEKGATLFESYSEIGQIRSDRIKNTTNLNFLQGRSERDCLSCSTQSTLINQKLLKCIPILAKADISA